MAILQSEFTAQRGTKYEGQIQRATSNTIDSGTTASELGYGKAAVNLNGKVVPFLGSDNLFFEGVAVRQFGSKASSNEAYAPGDTADIIFRGRVAIKTGSYVTRGNKVSINPNGTFGMDTTADNFIIAGAYYMETAEAGTIVDIELNGKSFMEAV